MPKKYTMVDSSGQRHTNVYDEDMPEFMEMFPGSYILETFVDNDLVTQQEAEEQADLMNQPTDYESVLKSELSEYDNINKRLEMQYDTWFDSAQERDAWTQSLSPEEQEHVKNREFDKLSIPTRQSLNIIGLTGGGDVNPLNTASNVTGFGIFNLPSTIKKGALSPRRLSKIAEV